MEVKQPRHHIFEKFANHNPYIWWSLFFWFCLSVLLLRHRNLASVSFYFASTHSPYYNTSSSKVQYTRYHNINASEIINRKFKSQSFINQGTLSNFRPISERTHFPYTTSIFKPNTMACTFMSRIGTKCLHCLGIKPRSRRSSLVIVSRCPNFVSTLLYSLKQPQTNKAAVPTVQLSIWPRSKLSWILRRRVRDPPSFLRPSLS